MDRFPALIRAFLLGLVLLWHGQLLAGHLDHGPGDSPSVLECIECAFGGAAGTAVIESSSGLPIPNGQATPSAASTDPLTHGKRRAYAARAPPF